MHIGQGNMQTVVQVNLPLPCTGTGKPQRADGAARKHAIYIISTESYTLNTGSFPRNVKGSGQ
jgi:hypothetical protein